MKTMKFMKSGDTLETRQKYYYFHSSIGFDEDTIRKMILFSKHIYFKQISLSLPNLSI